MKESDLSISLGDGPDQTMHRGHDASPSPGTVLVVNKLPHQLQLLSATLKTAGYDVLEAANPKSALKQAADEPDLIVHDISMSETDGIKLYRRLRARLDLASTPILLLSNFRIDTLNNVEGIEADADHFLQAPYDQLELIARVGQLIERKRTQAALRRSEERYRELFDNANDIVYTHDLDGRYTSLNKKGKELTGYTREEAAALDFNTLATPKDVALAKKMLQRKLKGQETSTVYEISILAKDGRIIPVEVNTQLIYENGRPTGVQGIARDIRARKEAEEKFRQVSQSLLEAERRAITEYKTLLERIAHLAQVLASARDLGPIFKALLEFTTISLPCNALGIALYDHEQAELNSHFLWIEGNNIDITDLEPFPVTTNSDVRRAIVSGQTIIATACRPDHPIPTIFDYSHTDLKPASAMTVPMTIMGRTIGTLEIQCTTDNAYQTEDTTALQMAANLAANTIENVRLLNREREHESQLRQAQKMEAIGHLAGGVAHDFNNIVTAMYGNCDMLMRGLEPGNSLRKHVHDLRDSAKRAAMLTKQLLAFSRKQVLQPVNLNLNTVVTDMERLIARLIGEDISVTSNLVEDLPQIKADKSQLEQIIMNLAVNARDAMPQGGKIIIETSVVYLDKKCPQQYSKIKTHPHIQLSITDTGTGMSAETQKHIFEPFFTTKEEGKGTGLGLATVFGSVKQSRGYIWVHSKEGEGTVFKIHFPIAKEHLDILPEHRTEATDDRKGTQTILIAEDDHTVRQVLRDALHFSGYKILEAANGGDGWELFQQHQDDIQLVITDVLMPKMNGRKLALLINTIRPTVRIIYISGHPTDAITDRGGVLLEGVDFLEKPFTNNDVIRKVREVLGSSEILQPATAK
jgi:two-component system cell cycle sensor histidine kinase/response regulator CckA